MGRVLVQAMCNQGNAARVVGKVVFVMAMFGVLNPVRSGWSASTEGLSIHSEAEGKYSHFKRDPDPALASSGSNFSQEYRMYLEGDMLQKGWLDSSFGVLFPDKYRTDDVDFEKRIKYDYGKWLKLGSSTVNETDEDIFFTATNDPQSPINSVTDHHEFRWALNNASTVEYDYSTIERKDVLLGSIMNELTETEDIRFTSNMGVMNFEGGYRTHDLKDNLGVRSDIESRDIDVAMTYTPEDHLSFTGFLEDSKDFNVDNFTELSEREMGVEVGIKPYQQLKFRDRIKVEEREDTQAIEKMDSVSNEIIMDFDPQEAINLQLSYRKEKEDKARSDIKDIDGDIDEGKFRMRLSPFSEVDVQSGYEVTNKESSLLTENTRDTKIYTDLSFQPATQWRLGLGVSKSQDENTLTSLVKSDSTTSSASVQYRPMSSAMILLRYDTTETENPSTDSFTKTDTIGTHANVDFSRRLGVIWRSSFQRNSGSSESSTSERILNSVGTSIQIFDHLRVSPQYEIIDSSGASASDEKLMDLSVFYTVHRMDLTLRVQDRNVVGATPLDKLAFLGTLKYRINQDTVWSLKYSGVDFVDDQSPQKSYDSALIETTFSKRF